MFVDRATRVRVDESDREGGPHAISRVAVSGKSAVVEGFGLIGYAANSAIGDQSARMR